ncbi:type III secretion system export apparatus subunit SctU [Paraburkholderia ginsengiterrae]|uniref:EscU/YscU/HrcU family type III secretion system export apparatus switch protein n=1 Tax=Paraburkholderia ginsengiterrae TaxID=1462993 RepID=A0A1A9NA93_9BURK|nr:type III secretion system export apparatus subunit SctU [Paraburkholderia ginsengiterrae]OAJ62863.1 EscU/YscU/HrcU family type III secretion system export apparatus switch protein [Paraburkholderia ginsengiterrae]
MSDEKTEQPTEKRLRDARKEGQVSKSTDLTDSVTMSAVIGVLILASGSFAGAFRAIVATALDFVSGDHSLANLFGKMTSVGGQSLLVVVPFVLIGAVAALAALIPQVGFKVATKPVVPNPMNASPINGFKRIFSWRTVIELVKMIIKAVIIGFVMWFTIKWMLPLIVGSLYQPLPQLSKMFWDLLLKLCSIAAGVFVVIGSADVKLQHAMFIRKMRMSKDEVKREHKQQEGDPKIKGERRRLAREFASSAGTQQRVGFANALIVNPTHYAVAIRYAPSEHPLPLVTAKGMDESAAQLRGFAQQANVPIIGNPPVARALYKVGLDEPIPEELFETVAAILRWVEAIGANRQSASSDDAAAPLH